MRDLVLLLCLLFAAFAPGSEAADALLQRLDGLLQRNQTVELLDALKGAQDSDALLDWLKMRADEGYPAAQFELGRRLFVTDKRKGLSWYLLGDLNRNIDMNLCKDFRRTRSVNAKLGELALKVPKDEAQLWADALDDFVALATTHGVGTRGKQPPWWICTPGEARPMEDELYPSELRVEKRSRIWRKWLVSGSNSAIEIRLNANLNSEKFRIHQLEKRYWEKRLNSDGDNLTERYFSAVWIDDNTLLFGGYRVLGKLGDPHRFDPIYRWNIETNEITEYADTGFGLCYFRGFISYYVLRDARLFYREGMLGQERETSVPAPEAGEIGPGLHKTNERYQCRRGEAVQLDRSIWQLEYGGRIKREGSYEDKPRAPLEYYGDGSDKAFVFDPYGGRTSTDAIYWTAYPPKYSAVLDAYWLTVVVAGLNTDPISIWVLHRNGAVERHDVAQGPWAGARFAPAKTGWFALTGAGLYFLGEKSYSKILSGRAQAIRVSPNGCRAAVSTPMSDGKGDPLWVIDVCERERVAR